MVEDSQRRPEGEAREVLSPTHPTHHKTPSVWICVMRWNATACVVPDTVSGSSEFTLGVASSTVGVCSVCVSRWCSHPQKIDETVQAQASINSAACESEAEGESDEYGPSKRSRHGRSPSANPPSAATKDTSKTPPAKRSKKSHQQRAAKRHWWRRSQALSRNWVS